MEPQKENGNEEARSGVKENLKSQLDLLAWVIRISYCGMPVSYFRHMLLKRHEELEKELSK